MKTLYLVIIVVGITAISIGMFSILYLQPEITISTDKKIYDNYDGVEVTGTVKHVIEGHSLVLTVIEPNGTSYNPPTSGNFYDGKYDSVFSIGPSHWKDNGTYKIIANYGDLAAETNVIFNHVSHSSSTNLISNDMKSHILQTGLQCENEFKPKAFEIRILSNGTSLTINYVPVFLMKPNSTGKICTNNWRTMPPMNYSGKVTAGIGKDDSIIQNVSVVADPDVITIDDANKTIAYTITASKDASGFYRFNPMFSNCGGIPIAIGYDSTRSFDNDFPWLWETVPCPLGIANTEITGLTGIDVTYITKEY